jgi:hypothetical protein
VVMNCLVHVMNSYRGGTDIAPYVLNLGVRWRSVVNFMSRPLYRCKILWCLLTRKLGGPKASLDVLDKPQRNSNIGPSSPHTSLCAD